MTLLSVSGRLLADLEGDEVVCTVKLVDAGGEVLAGGAAIAPSMPAEFVLTADPALVPDPSEVFVWAAARADDVLWGTPELVRVSGDAVDVTLSRVSD